MSKKLGLVLGLGLGRGRDDAGAGAGTGSLYVRGSFVRHRLLFVKPLCEKNSLSGLWPNVDTTRRAEGSMRKISAAQQQRLQIALHYILHIHATEFAGGDE